MDEFIQEFLIEGSELLDQLDRDFVELESNPTSKELVARIFRAIHTLKGSGGTIGLRKIESVNHHGENILARMRDGKLSLNAEITSALLSMIDLNRQLFASLESTGQEGELDCSCRDSVPLRDPRRLRQKPCGEAAPAAANTARQSLRPTARRGAGAGGCSGAGRHCPGSPKSAGGRPTPHR